MLFIHHLIIQSFCLNIGQDVYRRGSSVYGKNLVAIVAIFVITLETRVIFGMGILPFR